MRDEEMTEWFGPVAPIGQRPTIEVEAQLRELGDEALADELVASAIPGQEKFYSGVGMLDGLLNRFVRTIPICGFLPVGERDHILPVTKAKPDPTLQDKPLRITLDGLYVARYPGLGIHTLLFDFALKNQRSKGGRQFHYIAKFQGKNGEFVPVRNFPLFYGFKPTAQGITFGFQTVNVASSFDEGLLNFLGTEEFKTGLSLVGTMAPVLGQISQMSVGLTTWLAGQSKNAKVQEFLQGLDFESGPFGGGLAAGYYIVVQIPVEHKREWNWDDWVVDPTLVRLVNRSDTSKALDFNYVVFGFHLMK